ncbi:MAG TPA: DUF4230 domain-containing protein [Clostridiales bacterium]|nr:DUF4230 domain-containing protein [Clostridiales bacterium]
MEEEKNIEGTSEKISEKIERKKENFKEKVAEEKAKGKRRYGRMKELGMRLLIFVFALVVGFTAGTITSFVKPLRPFFEKLSPVVINADEVIEGENYILTRGTIEEIVKPAADLITTKYKYKDAGTYEDFKTVFGKKVPGTTDKVVYTYKGTISVGVDLSNVEYDIDNENKIIKVSIPDLRIMTNEIDASSFEYPFVSDSVFNPTVMENYTNLIATLKSLKEEELKKDKEFMDEAKRNTRNVIQRFLTFSDATKDYNVIFQ